MLAQDAGWDKAFKWSVVANVAGTGADAASSWGGQELNPVLGPSFGGKALMLKGAVAAGVFGIEWVIVKKTHSKKAVTLMNFAQAGLFGGAAIHNVKVR